MKPVAFLAWAAFALAAFLLFLYVNSGLVPYLSSAISSSIAGVLFLAVQQVIDLLTDIRDTLRNTAPSATAITATPADDTATTNPEFELRSLDEIDARIKGAKQRHQSN